jgi:nicotinamide-nucleotide adenylyltransferase
MCDNLNIVIGSAQASNTWYNPFTAKERRRMIEKSVGTIATPETKRPHFMIWQLNDIDDPGAWAEYVLNNVGGTDVLFSGNLDGVVTLFRKSLPNIDIIMFGGQIISGTKIREKMAMGGTVTWSDYLPTGSIQVIKACKGEERIFKIYHNMKGR